MASTSYNNRPIDRGIYFQRLLDRRCARCAFGTDPRSVNCCIRLGLWLLQTTVSVYVFPRLTDVLSA